METAFSSLLPARRKWPGSVDASTVGIFVFVNGRLRFCRGRPGTGADPGVSLIIEADVSQPDGVSALSAFPVQCVSSSSGGSGSVSSM